MSLKKQFTVGALFLSLALAPAQAAATDVSSWNPTLLVNTEAFQTIDDADTAANVRLKFGETLQESLIYNRSAARFEFTRALLVGGNLTATGALSIKGSMSGASLRVDKNADIWGTLAVSGTTILDGTVGIGTTAPETKLEVVGTASGKYVFGTDGLGASGTLVIRKPAGTATGNLLVIDRTGLIYDGTNKRVGIGTTSPGQKLSVIGNIDASGSLFQTTYASEDGLILYWPMNENTGTALFDHGPKGHDALLSGTTASWGTGPAGYAVSTVGTGQAATSDDAGIAAADPATIETWIYITMTAVTRAAHNGIFTKLYQHAANNYLYLSDGGADYFNVASVLTVGKWHHLVLVKTGLNHSTSSLFVDGVKYSPTLQTSTDFTALSTFAVGTSAEASSPTKFDEVRIYNRALTDHEVRLHYLRGGQPSGVAVSDKFRIINSSATELLRVTSDGKLGIGTTAPETKLEVVGTASGDLIHAQKDLSSSGTLAWEGAASGASLFVARFAGANLTDCDTSDTSKLLWNTTTQTFSCGTDQTGASSGLSAVSAEGMFVNQGGDTMTGALLIRPLTAGEAGLEVAGTASGRIVSFGNRLTGSGTVTIRSGTDSATAVQVLDNDGGAPIFNVDTASERVGIGTAAPETSLEVVGTISGSLVTQNGAGNNYFMGNVGIGRTTPAGKLHIGAPTGVASPGSIALAIRDSDSYSYGFDFNLEGISTGDLSLMRTLAGNQTQVMTFQRATGNVGIGTTTPSTKLHVVGTGASANALLNVGNEIMAMDGRAQAANVGGQIGFGGKYTDAGAYSQFAGIRGVKLNGTTGNYSGQLEFFTRNSGDDDWTGDQRMVIDNAGKVGIGTTGPESILHLAKSGAGGQGPILTLQNIAVDTVGNSVGINFGLKAGAGVVHGDLTMVETATNVGALTYSSWNGSNYSERFRIDKDGKVGIGTTAPAHKLEVAGDLVTSNDDYAVMANSFSGGTLGQFTNFSSTVTSSGALGTTVTYASNAWGHGIYGTNTYARKPGLTFYADFRNNVNGYAMIGWHNSAASSTYTAMPHAMYFSPNGVISIYENGGNVFNSSVTWTVGRRYRVKITLKERGAVYYLQDTTTDQWYRIYESSTVNTTPLRASLDVYNGYVTINKAAIVMGNNDPWGQSLSMTGSLAVFSRGNNFFLGNLGIGTSGPTTKLEVVGTISGSQIRANNMTTSGAVVYSSGNTLLASAKGASGQVLVSQGTAAPRFLDQTTAMTWYIDASVATGTSQGPTITMPFGFTVTDVDMNVDTAPSGAALIVDINKDGASLFSTRPQINDGATAEAGTHAFSVTNLPIGSKITLDVDQVGSMTAGSDLTVTLKGTRKYY